MIETPPIQDFDRIQQDGFEIVQGLSNRVIYLHFTHGDEVPPGVSGTDGVNPFTDVRVREAISKAINREAIVDRVMGGFAVAAGGSFCRIRYSAPARMPNPIRLTRKPRRPTACRSGLPERLRDHAVLAQ